MHNLWRAKLLYDLNYGQPNFRSRDSKEVQEIISEAGKGSYAALGVELKRYHVFVPRLIFTWLMLILKHVIHYSSSKMSDSTEAGKLVHFLF